MVDIQPGSILEGPFWDEKLRVISVKTLGEQRVKIEAVGLKTNRYYAPILSSEELEKITIAEEKIYSFTATGEHFFLFLEALRIRNAFQFDPLYAVNVSRIDPLPHQIDAVYLCILRNPRVRFLLADDPGAGKTIMAGLLIKELKYRGLAKRIIIIVPGHLKDQWVRELKEKFQENFVVVDKSVMDTHWGQNVFLEKNQIVTSIDFLARNESARLALQDSQWDLCIVDEAHKMAAYRYGEKVSKTLRYKVGVPLNKFFLKS